MVWISRPTSRDAKDILRLATRSSRRPLSKSELEIYYNLCAGRVYFQEDSRKLYFVDSPEVDITNIIEIVFSHFDTTPNIEQLYMDQPNYIKASFCIALNENEIASILVALRVSGIHIVSL
ncbi:MAG: hypothetical protein HUJ30_07160 [Gammaproteobacteria bacterium]|nr:hypothetical protein [Gammaproteobacteria bacterium]